MRTDRRRALALLAAALLWGAAGARAAGPKSLGSTAVSDDLVGAAAGSVGLSAAGVSADGALGQTAVRSASNGTTVLESGFYAAAATMPASVAFGTVWASSLTLTWAEPAPANPAGTLYTAEASTAADFSGTLLSSQTYALTTAVLGLSANTTYYARVRAAYAGGEESTAPSLSTVTLIEAPTSVYIDEVTTHSIVAAAYAPTPAFTSLEAGVSATNITTAAAFGSWLGQGNVWTAKPGMSLARFYVAAAALGGKVYVVGGSIDGAGTPTGANEEFDPVANAWNSKAAMASARFGLGVAAAGGKLYAVGGRTASPSVVNEAYDPAANAWSTRAAMPTARQELAAASAGGKVYALGGSNTAANEEYDPATDSWTVKAPMPTARSGLAAAAMQGYVYAIAANGGGAMSKNERYDPGSNSWAAKADLPSPRQYPAAAATGGKIHVVGGYNLGAVATHEQYDPASDSWTARTAMPTARYGLAAAVVAGRVYAVGGQGGSITNINEAYDAGTSSSFTALTPNTQYSFKAKARNLAGAETAESPTVSTYTLAAASMPPAGTPIFSAISSYSVTVNFSSGTTAGGFNGPGASYWVQASSMASFLPVAGSSLTRNIFAEVPGLTANTTQYTRVQAYNVLGGTDGSWFILGATATLANEPVSAASTFTAVASGTLSVAWGANGNAAGITRYDVALTTGGAYPNAFSGNRTLSTTPAGGNPAATVGALSANTTYYLFAAAMNHGGVLTAYAALGATATAIETPTTVYFDEVTTNSIVAAAYVPTPAFTGLNKGLSGTNVALGGNYAGWHGEKWTAKTAVPLPREHTAGAALAGRIYVMGGNLGGATPTATLNAYDPLSNAWTARAAMGAARWGMGVAALGGRLHAAAGDPGALALHEAYDPGADAWSVRAPLSAGRSFAVGASVGGLFHALGPAAQHDRYDPAANAWTARAALPVAMAPGAAAVGGKVYAIGGLAGDTLEYDPTADNWTARASMPTGRTGLRAAAVGGKIYVSGGLSGTYLAVHEEFDPGANAWVSRLPLPTARQNHAWVAFGGRLYAVGGGQSSALDANEEYDPGVASSFTALTPNTLYSFRAKARNLNGVETAETAAVSTYTLAFATMPRAGTPLFSAVYAGSVTVAWSSGTDAGGYNGAGATYLLQASTMASFVPVDGSSLTANSSATVEGLDFANATYYFRVRAYNTAGVTDFSWFVLGATVTAVEAPSTLYFDEVTTHSIVASAYAGGVPFSSMSVALSGTNLAIGGSYAGWHGEGWTARSVLPTAMRNPASVALGGKLYLLGADDGGGVQGFNRVYDPTLDTWSAKTSMSTARSVGAAGAIAGRIYVTGGGTAGPPSAVTETYDPAADSWNTKSPMPTARNGSAYGVVGGRLYVIGGLDASELNTNEVYDPVADAWATKAAMTTARTLPATGVLSGKVHVVGGRVGLSSYQTIHEAYDPLSNVWEARAPMSVARYQAVGGVIGGAMSVIGGFDGTSFLSVNERYNPTADSWSLGAPMPTARRGAGGLFVGNRMYVAGGNNGGDLAVHEAYDPGTASSFTALTPNTLYVFKAKARNLVGVETPETAVFSTFTLAAATVTQLAAGAFSPVYATSMTVAWSSGTATGGYNGPGAAYLVQAATLANFTAVAGSSQTFGTSAQLVGLSANATHYLRVRAVNTAGVPNDWFNLGTTVTLANPALSAVSTFTMVGVTSMTVTWDPNGNSPGTRYEVVFTTYQPFSNAVFVTTYPYGTPAATATGLFANATYYLAVRVYNRAGAFSGETQLGSTVTYIEAPTSIVIDAVSTHSIVAAAYAPAFSSMTAGLSGTNIALGGNYQGWHGEKWTTKAAMTTVRTQLGAGGVGGKLYVLGGVDGSYLAANEEYDPVSNGWTTKAAMPTARANLALGVAGGKVYALGGSNGPHLTANEEYDPVSNGWTTKAAMPTARSLFAAGVVGGKVYALGGYNGSPTPLAANEEYDPVANGWTAKAAMTTPRYRLAAGAVGGKVYALGGDNGSVPVAANEEYDPAANGWTTKAAMPTARQNLAAGVVGGKVYALGGTNGPDLAANEEYDPGANGWTIKAAMPTARQNLAVGVVGGKVYALGGSNGPILATNEEYDPGVASSFTALTPNTLYSFRAKARNSVGMETGETAIVSTYTLAFATVPAGGVPALTAVFTASATVNWASGTAAGGFNGPGASYLVEASTMGTFAPVAGSSTTGNSFATVSGLFVNATHYFRVRAFNSYGAPSEWVVLGATATAIEAPSSVYIEEVSSHSILAAAYVPTPAFTGLTRGLSGTNVSLGGAYDPARWHGEKWTAKADMITGRHFPAAAVVAGRIHVIGGNEGGNRSENEAYDPVTNTWASRQPLPFGQTELSAAVLDGLLYMVGGYANSSAVRSYDPGANAWTARANLTNNRWLNGTEALGGKLYTAAGANGFGAGCGGSYTITATVEAYDPVTGLWSSRTALPGARMNPGTAVLGGKMYLFGGCNFDNTTAVYDPVGDIWSTRAAVPIGIGGGRAAVVGGKAYYMGGTVNEEYDPAADAWTQRAGVLTTRSIFALAAFRGRLYAIGGDLSPKRQNEEYDPGTAQYFGGLTPNTQYTFSARARNLLGVETAETAAVSTYTLAAVPTAAAPTFVGAFISSISLQWADSGNPAPTEYRLRASTAANFSGGGDVVSAWFAATSTQAVVLSANTTYYFRVRARNGDFIETAELSLGATVTLAAEPASAASTYSAVASTSFGLAWLANGNGAGTRYEAAASTAVLPNGLAANLSVSTRPSGAPAAFLPGLAPNTTYYTSVRALSHAGIPTQPLLLGATVTLAEPPAASTAPFAGVFQTSMTVQWSSGTNPAWTQYRVDAATSADYGGLSWSTDWQAFTSTTVSGLTRNTTYYLRAQARNVAGIPTSFLSLGATATLANYPVDGGNPFPTVFVSSLTTSWATAGNPSWTRYEAVVSTVNAVPDGSADEVKVSTTEPSSALLTGLAPNSTQYLFVRALNFNSVPSDWSALGATATRIEAPTVVYFDEVTSNTIVASAYAPTPAFTNLHLGTAGTNVAIGGVYAGWHRSSWAALAPMFTARDSPVVAAAAGKIYAVGGWAGSSNFNVNEEFDPATNAWTTRAPMPTARRAAAGSASDGIIYVVGGFGGSPLATNERYDPSLDVWSGRTPSPASRHGPAAATIGGRIYVVGGYNGSIYLSRNDQYDPAADVWSAKAIMAAGRETMGAAAVAERLYAVGGSAGGLGLDTHEQYDSRTDIWTPKTPLPTPRRQLAAASVGGKVYAVGGSPDGFNALAANEEYDPAVNIWAARSPMPTARTYPGAAAYRGRVYVIGGYNGGRVTTNEAFDPGVSGVFSGLTPNTPYAFRAKARNLVGTETPETVDVTTYTLAAVPSTATPAFAWVGVSSAAPAWTSNGNPPGTQYRLETSTAADWSGAGDLLTDWFAGTSTDTAPLTPNTTYYWRAQARNVYGAETAWATLGATATLAAAPGANAASTFTAVYQSSVTAQWTLGANPAGTEFLVRTGTSAGFGGTVFDSGWLAGLMTTFAVLTPDTTYYWRVAARNRGGLVGSTLELGAQATLAQVPGASTEPFHRVYATSATVQWDANGNPAATLYEAQASTSGTFAGTVRASGWVAFLSTTVTGLTGDATYFWRVRARGVAGAQTDFLTLGSTPTAAADPPALAAASVGPGSLRAEWSSAGNREAQSLGAWAVRTALPAAVERHAAALVNGRLYVTGGVRSGAPSAEVWSAGVSPAGTLGAWRREADLLAARESHAVAAFGGRLYVVGGFEGSAKATVYSADLSAAGAVTAWRNEAGLPAGRFKLAAAAHAGWLYAFGGDNGVVSQGTVYRAPLAADGSVGGWAAATALPSGRNSHAAAVSGGRVYVAGGLGAGVEEEVWSAALSGPTVGAWRAETSLPVPVFRHALLATGGALVLVGGHDGTGAVAAVRTAALAADGTVGAWESLTPLPLGRFGHAAALETGNILVVGGSDDASPSADAYQAALGGTEYLLERAQDAGFAVDYASSNWRAGAGAEVPGLTPNRSYRLRLRARSRSGAEGALLVTGSTLTPAAVPGSAASTFSLVEAGSVTLTWADGGNPAGTEFLAALSTSADFTALLDTGWTTALSSAVVGLSPNTTYYAAALARDSAGRLSREQFLGSTVTAAAVPQQAAFPSVLTTGLSVEWSTAGNPAGTRYEAVLATASAVAPLAASSVTFSSGAAFSGLLSATTYYLRVRAFNRLGTPTAFSATTSAVTGADFTAPAAAGGLGLHATETPGVLLAAWVSPGDDGAAGSLPPGSRVYLQWTAADPAAVAWSTANAQLSAATGPVTPGAPASLVVTGLTPGTSVYARVWTLDESNNVSAPSATAPAWASPFTLSRLDGAGSDAGRWASLALDRLGDAHAAYTAGTITQELRYLKRAGGVWSVAEAPDPGIPAEEAVIAMGASYPQMAYRNSSALQLKLAKRSAGWVAETVAAGDLHPGGLAVDATAFAHLSYFDAGLPGLRYARWNGAAWDLETVDAGAGRGKFSSLALDGASAPHIAYYDAAAGDLKYASRTAAGAWATSTVDAGVDAGSVPVVALDGAGNAFVVYVDSVAKDLKLARYDGAAWTLSSIDTARDVTAVRGLALDGAGRAVVSYYDGTSGDLVFGRFNGSGWETGAVDSYGDAGAWSALAVEADGGVLELHYDATAGDLKAGSWSAGLPAPLGGNPRGRVQAPAAFSGVVGSSVSIQWTWLDSAANELGWRLYGGLTSTGPFSVIAGTVALPATAGTGTQRLYTETGLSAGTTYFRYAAAVSSGGTVVSPMAALFPFNTVDTAAPDVLDNQGGDAAWRRAAGALYNVDFQDTGGSALSKFQVKAATVPGGAGPDVAPFTDVVVNILADTYTADWALPSAVFDLLHDGATHYVSVRVYDGAGNVKTSTDVFTVLKDTTPPAFTDNQTGDITRRAAGGNLYDVDVRDPASGLERFQYSVSTTAGSGDAARVGWTDVPLGAGATSFAADWAVDFANLLGDSANYVSVRSWDRAGSTAALTDVFFVWKDTGGPRTGVTAPAAAFRSVLTALAGTAADAAGVGGVSVAIQTAPPAGNWFDGAGFTAGAPVWLAASGTAAWTFGAVPAWTDGGAFRVVARASDTLGNLSVEYSTANFTFDSSTPTAVVTSPANGATLSSLVNLAGTATDPGGSASGLALLEVRVRRASDGQYWSWPTGAWGAAELSTSPAAGTFWTVPVPEALRAALAHGASYFVSVRASDGATPPNSGGFAAGSTFTWTDTTAPSALTNLSALTGDGPGRLSLTWTAPGDDGALGDIALGSYRIHYSTDPSANFSTAAAQVEFSTAGLRPGAAQGRLVTGLTAGATYHVRVFAADDAGNWSALSNGATAYAGNQPFNKILGHVMKASSEGVTAVKLEAYDASDLRVSQGFSLADGSGTFSLDNVPDGVFRVQATWTVEDFASSVWLDNIAVGSFDVDFRLEINYTLATLTGTLASLSAQAASPTGFLARAAENGFAEARVDLMRAGEPVAAARPDPAGRWNIPNLLPGKYAVRAFNGLDYTEAQEVQLGEGETREVVFVFDPLPEAAVFAFPNPARSKTTFRFVSALPALEAQVTVFDIAGTLVKELPGSAFAPGPGGVYRADWDLTNDDGESVASGVYLFMTKVKGANGQSGKVVKKLAVVR